MDSSPKTPIIIGSLCTGYGGIELGLKRIFGQQMRTAFYVEREIFACANLVAKMEAGLLDAAPVWTDIKTFNGWPFRKNIHIITAGYPCQGESCAGKRRGADDPRWLWPYIARIIEAVEPVWFFGENVSGHLTLGFPTVYRSLRNLGYSVEAGLFTAAECGAPHKRERLFILAKSSRAGARSVCGAIRGWDRSKNVRQGNGQACSSRAQPASQLADTKYNRRRKICVKKNRFTTQQFPIGKSKAGGNQWPAQPEQLQYEWEEPRVVGDSKFRGRPKGSGKREKYRGIRQTACITSSSKKRSRKYAEGQQETQSRLGRAINGTACRVDRLQLLGNGVVPQQAEKAFRYLMELFNNDKH